MNNNSSYNQVPPPPVESLQSKAEGIASSLREVNEKLKFIKQRLFGMEPDPPKTGHGSSQAVSDIHCSTECSIIELGIAHERLSEILARL